MEIRAIKKSKAIFKIKPEKFCKSWLWNKPRFNIQAAYFDLFFLADDKGTIQGTLGEFSKRWRVSRQTAFVWITGLMVHGYIDFDYNQESYVYAIKILDPGNGRP